MPQALCGFHAPLDDGAALRAAGAVQVFRSMADLPALLGC